ncbi:MAG: hypothetical protein Q8R98_14165, partial [Rubrivivax sp.]|nr:hypothetical protein [Rubrivivax sp.]
AVDYIVASHVIEHTTDVCGFLMDCSSLLSDRGVLLLAIPDRSCVLDFYRPASTLGDVLLAHVDPQAYDVKSRMDEVWYGALLDGGGAWSLEHLTLATREGRVPLPQHGANVGGHVWMQSLAQAKARQDSASRAYRDAHRWALDPHSFAEIVGFLEVFAALGLHMEALPGGFGCEFYAVLRKQRTVVGVNSTELESVRSRAMQARRQRVVPPA